MAEVTGMTPARIAQEITNKVGVLQSNVAAELSKKANTTYVDSELSEKANTTDVASELSEKADTTYVNTELSKKASTTYVNTELSKKAYITYVDNGLSEKADTTYVNSELSEKADTTYVNSELSEKADKTYVDNSTNVVGYPTAIHAGKFVKLNNEGKLFIQSDSITNIGDIVNKWYVDNGLSEKADTTYVDSGLSEKADTTYVNSELSEKADTTYVNSELSKKADKSYVDNSTSVVGHPTAVHAGKFVKLDNEGKLFVQSDSITNNGDIVNKWYVDNGLSEKADTTYVDSELSEKADTTYVDSELSEKADTTYVKSELSEKADTTYVDSEKADKTDVEDARWWKKTSLPADTNFNDVRDPSIRVMLGGTHESAPFDALGTLEVLPSGYGGIVQRATNWATLEVWKRTTRGGVFQEWVRELTQDDVEDARWWKKTSLAADTNFNDVRDPSIRIMLGGTHESAPFNTVGTLEVLPSGYGGIVQRATNWSTLDVWKRRTQGGVFQEWVREPTLADVNAVKALIPTAESIQNTVNEALSNIDIESAIAEKADKTYVDDARWVQPTIRRDANYDDLRTPSVRVMMGPAPEAVNPPFNNIGIFEVLPTGYNGIVQRATNWGTLEVWKRRTQGGVFQEWVREPTLADVNAVKALIPTAESIQNTVNEALSNIDITGTATDWTRRVPLAVTTGAGPSEGPGAGTYRIRTQFTAPITRWRLHVSTRYPVFPTIRDGSNIQNVSIAENLGDGNIGTPVVLASNIDIAAGDSWISRWQTYDLSQDSLISMDVTPDGSHYNLLAPAWKDGVQINRAPLWVWIEAETYTDTPTVALIGDSTGAGHGSIEPVWDAAVAIAGRKQEFLPVLYSNSGDTLSGNVTIDDLNFTRWEGFNGCDSVIIQAGSNDIHASNRTLEVMQDNFEKAVDVAKQLGAKVYAATIKPRYPNDTAPDIRVPYNEWLKTLPAGISGVIDYDGAVAPDGVILPEDNDDGAHLTSSGHQKMAAEYSFPIARPRVVGTWKP